MKTERSTYRDAATGATVIQWTDGWHNNQHLYFTSPSVTADDRWLVFISDRDGQPNLYAIDRRNGAIRQLTANVSGLLKSYVYPQGSGRGLAKSSPCLDAACNRVFYARDDAFFFTNIDADRDGEELLWKIPNGWVGAFNHISPDGRLLCVPLTDPRAFADDADNQWTQMRMVAARMEREKLTSRIYLIDTVSGAARLAAETPFWVTHVQFDPTGSGRIIFNREGFAADSDHPPRNRIWCLDSRAVSGTPCRPLSPEPPGEWRAHENWTADGGGIVYHGGRAGGAFVAARDWGGKLLWETSVAGIQFWHATGAPDGRRIFADQPDGFISLLDPFAAADGQRVRRLCRHNTTIENQDAHAHPLVTLGGESLTFTSNQSGRCQVYEVLLPKS
ncbi:MAG: oligogalacturonate lyase family protein [Verrucomicrobiales bacterium]|jgi:hypothetical protein|nr:oligogalacturonate lyase family protein [Verrucomicrobiales bacterium]